MDRNGYTKWWIGWIS